MPAGQEETRPAEVWGTRRSPAQTLRPGEPGSQPSLPRAPYKIPERNRPTPAPRQRRPRGHLFHRSEAIRGSLGAGFSSSRGSSASGGEETAPSPSRTRAVRDPAGPPGGGEGGPTRGSGSGGDPPTGGHAWRVDRCRPDRTEVLPFTAGSRDAPPRTEGRGENHTTTSEVNTNKVPGGSDSRDAPPRCSPPPHTGETGLSGSAGGKEGRSFLPLRPSEGFSSQAPPGKRPGAAAAAAPCGRRRRRGQVGAAHKAPIHSARRPACPPAAFPRRAALASPRLTSPTSRVPLRSPPPPGAAHRAHAAAEGRSGAPTRRGTRGGSARIGRERLGWGGRVTSLRGHVTARLRPPAGKGRSGEGAPGAREGGGC